jgi:hypothetical protein
MGLTSCRCVTIARNVARQHTAAQCSPAPSAEVTPCEPEVTPCGREITPCERDVTPCGHEITPCERDVTPCLV